MAFRPLTKEELVAMPVNQRTGYLIEACKWDLRSLCTAVLGMRKWDDNLHGWVQRALDEPGKEKLFLLPRGHLKTSIITVGWSIQQMLRNPNVRILINNAVWENARTILSQIAGYLTTKSYLKDLYGEFKGPSCRWNQDQLEILQRSKGTIKEPTFDTSGVEAAKTGQHYDIIINDDIVVRENVTTAEQIEKVMNFHRDCYALLDPGGIIIDVGTRWAMNDVYGQIINTNMKSMNGYVFKTEEEKKEWRKYLKAA